MKTFSAVPSPSDLTPFIQAYIENRPLFYCFIRPQEAFLFHQAKNFIKGKVLDFGCGDGFFAHTVFGKKNLTVGLDVDSSRINETQQWPAYQQTLTYDGVRIPFKDHTFNTVISNSVFEHLPDLTGNLKEIHRILKPGGCLITSVMTDRWDQVLLGGKLLGQPYLHFMKRRQDHRNMLSAQHWQTAFNQAGFNPIQSFGYQHQKAARLNELLHFASFPSLLSYKLTGTWVPFKPWHQPLKLIHRLASIIQPDITPSTRTAAAIFYLLQKTT